MTGLLTSLRNLILSFYVTICRRGDRTLATWTPCSFDCYDEGGCHLCSTYVEWEDPDYGTCGQWVKREDINDFERRTQHDRVRQNSARPQVRGTRRPLLRDGADSLAEAVSADHDHYLPVEDMTDRERDWWLSNDIMPCGCCSGSCYCDNDLEVSSESVASDTTVTNNFSQADGSPEAKPRKITGNSETGEGTLPPLNAQITLPTNEHELYLSSDLERIRFIDVCQAVGLEFPNNKKGA